MDPPLRASLLSSLASDVVVNGDVGNAVVQRNATRPPYVQYRSISTRSRMREGGALCLQR
jgi:hypothetical protein